MKNYCQKLFFDKPNNVQQKRSGTGLPCSAPYVFPYKSNPLEGTVLIGQNNSGLFRLFRTVPGQHIAGFLQIVQQLPDTFSGIGTDMKNRITACQLQPIVCPLHIAIGMIDLGHDSNDRTGTNRSNIRRIEGIWLGSAEQQRNYLGFKAIQSQCTTQTTGLGILARCIDHNIRVIDILGFMIFQSTTLQSLLQCGFAAFTAANQNHFFHETTLF